MVGKHKWDFKSTPSCRLNSRHSYLTNALFSIATVKGHFLRGIGALNEATTSIWLPFMHAISKKTVESNQKVKYLPQLTKIRAPKYSTSEYQKIFASYINIC